MKYEFHPYNLVQDEIDAIHTAYVNHIQKKTSAADFQKEVVAILINYPHFK